MITLRKLLSLPDGNRSRKTVALISIFYRKLCIGEPVDLIYLEGLVKQIRDDTLWMPSTRRCAQSILASHEKPNIREINDLKHNLLNDLGKDWADWDAESPGDFVLETDRNNSKYPVRVYLEDLRSPFNVGSVARTAAAFGVEKLLLSPGCTSLNHPRAKRSAMGAVIPWDIADLDTLDTGNVGTVFALELGGCSIRDFQFPSSGTLILGSEELGVSMKGMQRAHMDGGIVSIPLKGMKSSLNVGVAFGILIQHWIGVLEHKS